MRLGMIISTIALLGLVACSSTPKTAEELRTDSRSQYISDVKDSLSHWEDRAIKIQGDRAADLRASISDARAELRSLQDASKSDWRAYRDQVDSRLDHLQELYDDAKAE